MIGQEEGILFRQSSLSVVAHDFNETLYASCAVMQRTHRTGTPEPLAVFSDTPAIFFTASIERGLSQ